MGIRFLTDAEEFALWRRLKADGDTAAGEELGKYFAPLVFKVAAGVPMCRKLPAAQFEAWIAQGHTALHEAIGLFDPGPGSLFAPFAERHIRHHLRRFQFTEEEGDESAGLDGEMLALMGEDASAGRPAPGGLANLSALMVQLPEKEFAVLRGLYIQRRSRNAIAMERAISHPYLERLHQRGLARLKGMLRKQGRG